jgi:drug/metabolite transporter (DMT)-like permease
MLTAIRDSVKDLDQPFMQPASLALLLGAAFLHAGANAFMKKARDKLAFTWWMLGVSTVAGLPLLLAGLPQDRAGWTLVVVSGVLEAVYFIALAQAYSKGDLSQVYPIARGSAPLFILAWAGLFLHERPSVMGLVGVITIVAGLYLINLPALSAWKRPLSSVDPSAQGWALVTGVLISAYATVDKAGVERVSPAAYLVLILAVAWLALAAQWLHAGRRQALLAEIGIPCWKGARGTRWRIVLAALFGVGAYLLVLVALRYSPVSYIGAVREVSVVIGAWMGVRFFGERAGRVRLIASTLVVLGIGIIAVAG